MRYISPYLAEFTQKKFLLLSGPRQVGKTTVANEWLAAQGGEALNWDVPEQRRRILNRDFVQPHIRKAILLDELHKHHRWKAYLKGLYDSAHNDLSIVVTGSARLDVFQRGGDSLLGRYEYLRLHPFSVGELTHGKLLPPPKDWTAPGPYAPDPHIWPRLLRNTGFPEPYSEDNVRGTTRWSNRRRSQLLREDLREISAIKLLSLVEQLYLLLPERVGSPLSLNTLSEDLQVSFETVREWLTVLERLYIHFEILPYTGRISRSLRKARKIYLFDWTEVTQLGARLENMVAAHLLKAIHAWNDVGYGEYGLAYWRDRDGNEVDFVITNRRKPVAIVEVKTSDDKLSKSLSRLASNLGGVPMIQLVDTLASPRKLSSGVIMQADHYLANLP